MLAWPFLSIIISIFFFSGVSHARSESCAQLFRASPFAFRTVIRPSPAQLEQLLKDEDVIHDLVDAYMRRLGLYRDPFALAFTPKRGEEIFRDLSIRYKAGREVPSPLAIVNFNLKRTSVYARPYNPKLIEWLIEDSQVLLPKNDAHRTDLQSNLLALKYALEYMNRYKDNSTTKTEDSTENPDEEKKKKPEEKKKEKKEKPPKQKAQPRYPDMPKEYKPETPDQTQNGGESAEKFEVARVNFATPYFASGYFTNVVRGADMPFKKGELPVAPRRIEGYRVTDKEMEIQTFGELEVDMFFPPGYRPLQPSDPRAVISTNQFDSYTLKLKEPLEKIRVPLVPDVDNMMLLHVREVYTRPVGFGNEEWPLEVQSAIIQKFSVEDAQRDPLAVTAAINTHIKKEYLYSLGARPETDPVDALEAGAFVCNMAAYAMIGLLRDTYQIPSRLVRGFRAKQPKKIKDGNSYLILPEDGHVWVEVFHEGRWHTFDPTPTKKDRKDNRDKEESEWTDMPNEDAEPDDSQDDDVSEDDGDEASQKDEAQEATKESEKGRKSDQDEKKEEERRNKAAEEELEAMDKDDLIKQLELGSLELEPSFDRNPLLERIARILLRHALDPNLTGTGIQDRLNRISEFMKYYPSPEVKQFMTDAKAIHLKNHPTLNEWIANVRRRIPDREVNETYHDLHRIVNAISLYIKTLDKDGKIPVPYELLATLVKAKDILYKLIHPQAGDMSLVDDLVRGLPAIPQMMLDEDYGLKNVGPNSPTKNIADGLRSGALKDLRLLANLVPHADFILNSTPRPEKEPRKTWMRNFRKWNGRELLPTKRISDWNRLIVTNPGKSIEENLQDGTAYVSTKRKRIVIPTGHGIEEAERISIVLYDTSGSMANEPGEFQAGLISAFVSKALSDRSPVSGRHRHKAIIIPFDGTPGTPVHVTNVSEALNIIRNYKAKLKNTGGSTDIQLALMQAMALIADAETRNGEPLAAANIILMTDGEASINKDELIKARNAFDRTTPLQIMFVAINKTNPDLMDFAMNSQSFGADNGFYREFSPEKITQELASAAKPQIPDRDIFFTDEPNTKIDDEVSHLLSRAANLAFRHLEEVQRGSRFTPAKQHLENLEKAKWNQSKQVDRPLENWDRRARQVLESRMFRNDRKLLEQVVDDLVTHFERLTGISFNDLSQFELEHLRHLVRYAATGKRADE